MDMYSSHDMMQSECAVRNTNVHWVLRFEYMPSNPLKTCSATSIHHKP